MSDVERLRAELALAEAMEPLEAARERMHADRSPENVEAYKQASSKAVLVRQAFRETYPPVAQSGGDGVAAPDTVKVTTKVQEAG